MRRSNIVAAIVSAAVASVISVSVSQAVNPLGGIASGKSHVHVTKSVVHDFQQTDSAIGSLATNVTSELAAQAATAGQVSALTTKVDALTTKLKSLTNTVNSLTNTVNGVHVDTLQLLDNDLGTQTDLSGLQNSDVSFESLLKSTAERVYAICYNVDQGTGYPSSDPAANAYTFLAPCYSNYYKFSAFRPDDLYTATPAAP
jgi:hypothetical protein